MVGDDPVLPVRQRFYLGMGQEEQSSVYDDCSARKYNAPNLWDLGSDERPWRLGTLHFPKNSGVDHHAYVL